LKLFVRKYVGKIVCAIHSIFSPCSVGDRTDTNE
jgi:hypothetical protein